MKRLFTQLLLIVCINDPFYLMSLVNNERVNNGLSQLEVSKQLTASSQYRAFYLERTGKWSHDGYIKAILNSGYKGRRIGENLAKDFECDNQVIEAWMKSPGHRANILNDKWRFFGLTEYKSYRVLHFGG